MLVRDLPPADQDAIRRCLVFVLESGELDGEFHPRLGVSEAEVRALLAAWSGVDDTADDSDAAVAIHNALNEVCHGIDVRDWDRWFTVSPAEVKALYGRWARGRGWSQTGIR